MQKRVSSARTQNEHATSAVLPFPLGLAAQNINKIIAGHKYVPGSVRCGSKL